jgi:repressor LexA
MHVLHRASAQLRILNFIRGFILERQLSPTLEEIAGHFKISRVTAHEHIGALEKKGALKKAPNRARSIELADDPRDSRARPSALPLLGTIAAGTPIEALAQPETLDLADWLPGGDEHFVLRVRGNSMIEDGIVDGDLVVVERRSTARDGEVVVALVDGKDATLKRFYREADRIRLQPANAAMAPIYVQDVTIQGVLVGLLRRFDRR